ncbi:protein unc-45 homolog B isoform X1 [Macrosteles quadrilineatus]|uniref:protein unc-45 homolog B isoform X1 n=1 Tax=Macrosteles quadrilineatus TaxID=74068 RepID=UPI0023E2CAAD|nr:protein unc-45 homolog B isoform X1 [Macrosteles quadrilineatus]
MTKESNSEDPLKLKEEGNASFKEGNLAHALSCYSKAIKLSKDETPEKAILFKNRAAVYLKQEDFAKALKDCDKSLEIVPNDPKTLFRRCQALENLNRPEEAYRDARQVHTVDPTNKAIQPVLARLHEIVQEKLRINAQTNNKIASMFEIAFDFQQTKDKRESAMNNILVLSRDSAGSSALVDAGVIQKIGSLLKVEKNNDIFLSGVRIVGELCRGSLQRTKKVLVELGIPWFLDILNCSKEEQVNASQYCLQTILNSLSGLDNKPDSKPDQQLCEENKKEIDTLLTCLIYATTSRTMTGLGRDAIIQLIMRNVHYKGIDWAETLIEIKGLQRLLEVGSELQEYKYESAMEITESTRTITAVCLARIYENMYYDKARERYLEAVNDYIKSKLITPEIESKVRVVVALTCLLLGPLDIGNTIVARDGMLEMILVMANSEEKLQQKVACECIIAAASKKDKIKTIISQGADILKKLYQSKDDSIRVRALVGLCKLGSMGGTDASIRPFADGSTTKLAEACRRFLISPSKDADMRRWAIEGLSYLTLDADVKEKLIDDKKALHAMVELAKSGNQACVYPTVTTLVNLCNAYEKQEVIPEMIELAKFAKHHIPEDHELDDPDFVSKRCAVLAKEGIISALVVLSKTESDNSKELICRVFNAICAERDLRGIVVQQGGAKVLFSMALEGTDKGKKNAAQALARIGITINPEVAFPGQRCVEIIRPLVMLLHPECTALESFESLMALCNLAGVSETVRKRIIKEGGVTRIEGYMFEEHLMLRRAATQCMTNLMLSPDIIKMYEGKNDRAKFLLLLCGEEDEDTAEAAAGALAMLTSVSKKCCKKLFEVGSWLENFQELLANPKFEMQHRGIVIMLNIIKSSKELAEKVMSTNLMELLMALSIINEEGKEKIKSIAEECLKAAEEWKIIKKPGEEEEVLSEEED